MKKLIILLILTILCTSLSYSQYSKKYINPTYRYVAAPGFVNITELSGAIAISDTVVGSYSDYYFGVTNIFGYQINRNFFGGIGTGIYVYEGSQLIPLFIEYKYSVYLRRITPFIYADGGVGLAPVDFSAETKIFLNPGIGMSVPFSSKLEGNLSVGLLVQSRSTSTRVAYINLRLGITYRKNPFRLFKPDKKLISNYY
jgi:hypothetical protein